MQLQAGKDKVEGKHILNAEGVKTWLSESIGLKESHAISVGLIT